jgi:phenylalanine-4-hydroxylase
LWGSVPLQVATNIWQDLISFILRVELYRTTHWQKTKFYNRHLKALKALLHKEGLILISSDRIQCKRVIQHLVDGAILSSSKDINFSFIWHSKKRIIPYDIRTVFKIPVFQKAVFVS